MIINQRRHIQPGQKCNDPLIALLGLPHNAMPYPDGQRLLKWTYSEAPTLITTEGLTRTVQVKNDKVLNDKALNVALSKS